MVNMRISFVMKEVIYVVYTLFIAYIWPLMALFYLKLSCIFTYPAPGSDDGGYIAVDLSIYLCLSVCFPVCTSVCKLFHLTHTKDSVHTGICSFSVTQVIFITSAEETPVGTHDGICYAYSFPQALSDESD